MQAVDVQEVNFVPNAVDRCVVRCHFNALFAVVGGYDVREHLCELDAIAANASKGIQHHSIAQVRVTSAAHAVVRLEWDARACSLTSTRCAVRWPLASRCTSPLHPFRYLHQTKTKMQIAVPNIGAQRQLVWLVGM